VLKTGLRLIRFDSFRQWNASEETAVAALAAMPAFALLLALLFTLTFKRKRVVGNFHFHIVLRQAGQVGAHDELAASFKNLDLRRPHDLTNLATAATEPSPDTEVFEHALHLV